MLGFKMNVEIEEEFFLRDAALLRTKMEQDLSLAINVIPLFLFRFQNSMRRIGAFSEYVTGLKRDRFGQLPTRLIGTLYELTKDPENSEVFDNVIAILRDLGEFEVKEGE